MAMAATSRPKSPKPDQQARQRNAHHDGHGEHSHTFGGGARDEKEPGGQRAQLLSEASLDQLIGGDQFAAKVLRYQHES